MDKKEVTRIIRLGDLYNIKYYNFDLKKELSKPVWLIKTDLEILKKRISDEVEKRVKKANKIARKFLKENPKKVYLKYYQKQYETKKM